MLNFIGFVVILFLLTCTKAGAKKVYYATWLLFNPLILLGILFIIGLAFV